MECGVSHGDAILYAPWYDYFYAQKAWWRRQRQVKMERSPRVIGCPTAISEDVPERMSESGFHNAASRW